MVKLRSPVPYLLFLSQSPQNGDTVFHLAARGGHTQIISFFLTSQPSFGQQLLNRQNRVYSSIPSSFSLLGSWDTLLFILHASMEISQQRSSCFIPRRITLFSQWYVRRSSSPTVTCLVRTERLYWILFKVKDTVRCGMSFKESNLEDLNGMTRKRQKMKFVYHLVG